MQTNEQLTNYLLWLNERGLTIPVYQAKESKPELAESYVSAFGGISPRILFVGDGGSPLQKDEHGPLPLDEQVLLQNIAKALKLSIDDFHYTHYFKNPLPDHAPGDKEAIEGRPQFLETVKLLNPSGIVILGSYALNFVSGKKLNFNNLRGKVFTPELYGIPTIATYHLRDMLQYPEHKSLVWSDLNLLNDHLKNQGL